MSFGSLGLPELIIIFVLILVLFGGSRLPQLGKGLGEFIKNFRSSVKGEVKEEKEEKDNNSHLAH